MRDYESSDEIERSCSNCGESEWQDYENDSYGGERDDSVVKTWLYCRECDSEGKLFEENGQKTWTGVLR